MKQNITINTVIALLLLLMPLSRLHALDSWALKSWPHIGGIAYIYTPLGENDGDGEYWGDDFNGIILDIGPSYSHYFNKKTSISINLTLSLFLQSYEYYGEYESDESYSGESYIYDKTVADNILKGELFTTLNRRLTNHITGFIGLKYTSTFLYGEYNVVSKAGEESSDSTDISDPTQSYFTTDSYGGGGGFATNFHTFGNLFFLSSFSYIYMFSSSSFTYGDVQDTGSYISHEPMVKLSFAYFFPSIKSTLEIGAQGKAMYYTDVLAGSDTRFERMEENLDIALGPVINFTMVFQ